MKANYFPLLLIASTAGCSAVIASQDKVSYQRGYDAAVAAYASFGSAVPDDQDTVPKPGDICSSCNGSGQVGDGRVFQKCLSCSGTGVVQAITKVITQDTAPGWSLIPGVIGVDEYGQSVRDVSRPYSLLPGDSSRLDAVDSAEGNGMSSGRKRGLFRRRRTRRSSSSESQLLNYSPVSVTTRQPVTMT